MVLFHLFFLCTAIRPKIRVAISFFLLFAHDHSTKIYDRLSFIFSLCTTIRSKISVLNIFCFYLYTTIRLNLGRSHSYSLIDSFLNRANISFAMFMALLPLYFVSSISGSIAFILRPLYSWPYYSNISYTIFMEVLLLYLVQYIHSYMKS